MTRRDTEDDYWWLMTDYWLLMTDDWWLVTDYSHIIYFSGVHQATQVLDCWLSSHGKCGWHGCPQADGVGERESSEFKQNLNGGPQADGGGEQVSINDYWWLILFTRKTRKGTDVRRRTLWVNGNCHQLDSNWKKNIFLIAVILQVIAVQEKELVVCGLQLP